MPTGSQVLGHVTFSAGFRNKIPYELYFNDARVSQNKDWRNIVTARNTEEGQRTMKNTFVVLTGGTYVWFGILVVTNTLEDAIDLVRGDQIDEWGVA